MSNNDLFSIKQATSCAEAFFTSTNIPTCISFPDGSNLVCFGEGCDSCKICNHLKKTSLKCSDFHIYGMEQAERFGGKYIYFCPAGFNFIVSPIMSDSGAVGYAKAGPFLMVDEQDYINYDLIEQLDFDKEKIDESIYFIHNIPYVAPNKVSQYSTLLYMSIGFINNFNICNSIIKNQQSFEIQGHIGEIIKSIKGKFPDNTAVTYPFEKEKELLAHISNGDKQSSSAILNDLLGYIFFYSSSDLDIIKARVYELIVLISRASVDGGADPNYIFGLNGKYIKELPTFTSIDNLCVWFTAVLNDFTDHIFKFIDVKHVDVIKKSIEFIRQNYNKKISLEEVASNVYLSSSYFSKVFKDEMKCNFNTYLNNVRIEKSKPLLLKKNINIVDISLLVGFEDQSYFTKVFKKVTGVSPGKFREYDGKIALIGKNTNNKKGEL